MPSRSWKTSTWPSVDAPAPMPMTGTSMRSMIDSATAAGVAPETIEEQPASRSAGALDGNAAALELDCVAARLLDEALGGGDRVLVGGLVGAEGEVTDQERRLEAAAHGTG